MLRRIMAAAAMAVLLPVSAGAATVTITVSNNKFTPNDVSISLHDTVHWIMPASGFHTVTNGVDFSDPDAGILFDHMLNSAGATFDYKFDTAGTFPFFCQPHQSLGMTGTIRVAATSVTPTAWAKIKKLYR